MKFKNLPFISRPQAGEFNDYHYSYIAKINPEFGPLQTMQFNLDIVRAYCENMTELNGNFAYAPGKWSIKEVLGHIMDCERIFAYRALRFARKDDTPLPGFDENLYVPSGNFNERTMAGILEEYETMRYASLTLFRSFKPETWEYKGTASGNPSSVRGMIWVNAGHEIHHLGVIAEKYLPHLA